MMSVLRPPTPPKPHTDTDKIIADALQFLDTSNSAYYKASLATPPTSSPRVPHANPSPSSSSSKRIRFNTTPIYIDEIVSKDPSTCLSSRLRTLPPSKSGRSRKSILKPVDASPIQSGSSDDASDTSPSKPRAFPEMLEHTVRQLAGTSNASKQDAYHILYTTLRTCKDIPHRELFIQKLPLLEDFIKRDIAARLDSAGLGCRALTLQAIKLLNVMFLDTFRVLPHLSPEFLDWVYEDTFKILAAASPPKELAKNQLLLFTYTDFCKKALTTERASNILLQLYTLSERVSGTAIQVLRLWIMDRLIECQQPVMLLNVRQWLPLVFYGLLSNPKELRFQAINLFQRAANSMGTSKHASVAVTDFFNLQAQCKSTNYEVLEAKLLNLLKAGGDHALQVPKIWASVINFLRGSPRHLETWKSLESWLQIIQSCFNTSDIKVHKKAFVAWNHLIAAIEPSLQTSERMQYILSQPIFSYLQRRTRGQDQLQARQAAIASYRLLLFYGFSPHARNGQWMIAWKLLIDRAIENVLGKNAAFAGELATLLKSLFSGSEVRIWNKNLVDLKSLVPLQRRQIPRISPGWVREHLESLLLPSIGRIAPPFLAQDRRAQNQFQRRAAQESLGCVIHALQEASGKEIKQSEDSRRAISSILRWLVSLFESLKRSAKWTVGVGQDPAPIQCCWAFVQMVVEVLGAKEFIQPIGNLSVTTDLVPSTPAITALVRLNLDASQPLQIRDLSVEILPTLLRCQQAASSPETRLVLMESYLHLLPTLTDVGSLSLRKSVWESISHLIQSEFNDCDRDWPITSTFYQAVIDVVHRSLCVHCTIDWALVEPLLVAALNCAERERHDKDAFAALHIPIAEIMTAEDKELSMYSSVQCLSLLLSRVSTLKQAATDVTTDGTDRQPNHTARDISGSWFKTLGSASAHTLHKMYNSFDASLQTPVCLLLKGLQGAIEGSGPKISIDYVEPLSSKFALWVANAEKRDMGADLSAQVIAMHGFLFRYIEQQSGSPSDKLRRHEVLLCAGLQSSNKAIASVTIQYWSAIFADARNIAYPQHLKHILLALRQFRDIDLPGIQDEKGQGPELNKSEQLEMFPWLSSVDSISPGKPSYDTLRNEQSAEPHVPSSGHVDPRSSSSSPRLHAQNPQHDDSQVDFVHIDSSPSAARARASSLLTEHQREVRERQLEEAVIFSDFHSSSPIRHTEGNHVNTNDLDAKREGAKKIVLEEELYADENVPSSPPDVPHTRRAEQAQPTRRPDYKMLTNTIQQNFRDSRSEEDFGSLTEVNEHQCLTLSEMKSLPLQAGVFGLDGQVTSGLAFRDGTCDQNTGNIERLAEPEHVMDFTEDDESQPPNDHLVHGHSMLVTDTIPNTRRSVEQATTNAASMNGTPTNSALKEQPMMPESSKQRFASQISNEVLPQRIVDSFERPHSTPTQIATQGQNEDHNEQEKESTPESEDSKCHDGYLIRPLSRSPPRTNPVVRVDVVRSSATRQRHSKIDRNTDSNDLSNVRVTRSSKRKASLQLSDPSKAKKAHTAKTMPKAKGSAMPSDRSRDNHTNTSADCIILGRLGETVPKPKRQRREPALPDHSSSQQQPQPHSLAPATAAKSSRRQSEYAERRAMRTEKSSSLKRSSSPSELCTEPTSSPRTIRVPQTVGLRKSPRQRNPDKHLDKTPLTNLRRSSRGKVMPSIEPAQESSQIVERPRKRARTTATTKIIETPFNLQVEARTSARSEIAREQNEPGSSSLLQASPTAVSHKTKACSTSPLAHFTFTTPKSSRPAAEEDVRSPSSSRSLSPGSASALAHSVSAKLRDLFQDVKKLFMGGTQGQEERQELEDAYDALGQEVRAAGRRRRGQGD